MYVFYIQISYSFPSENKLGVRKFRNLIEFHLQDFLSVASVLFCFTSVWAWVKNLYIKKLYERCYGYTTELFLQGQRG